MKLIRATIEIAIETEDGSFGNMCDTVSAIFSENLMTNGVIKDWQYANGTNIRCINGEFDNYEEGDVFNLEFRQK